MNVDYFLLNPEVEKANQRKSAASVAIFIAILILLAFLIKLWRPIDQTEEGIWVNFGTSEMGTGLEEPTYSENSASSAAPQPSPEKVEQVVAANSVDGPSMDNKTETKPKVTETKTTTTQTTTQQKPTEKPKIDESKVYNPNNQNNSQSTSQGNDPMAEGNKGQQTGSDGPNYMGDDKGKGNSGFGLLDFGSRGWLQKPVMKSNHQQRDVLYLEIVVDRQGNVISAEVARGTTLTDPEMIRKAKQAVMSGKLVAKSDAPERQTGRVKVEFDLK